MAKPPTQKKTTPKKTASTKPVPVKAAKPAKPATPRPKKKEVVVAVVPAKTEPKEKKENKENKMSGKALIAAAVGVAAAAAAGIAAFTTSSGKERTVYHLMPHDKGWQVKKTGKSKAESVHEKKRPARDEARRLASKNEPSQLVIHRTDGTIETVHTYGE